MNYKEFVAHEEIAAFIAAIGPTRTVKVCGETGIGKTSIQADLRRHPALQGHRFVTMDMTQMIDGTLWMPIVDHDGGVFHEAPNARFGLTRANQKGINGATPLCICLDEHDKASKYFQNYVAPLVYERRIGDMLLPDESIVWATTNLSHEGFGDSTQAYVRSRMIEVFMRKPTAQEWIRNYAIPNELAPELIAFVNLEPRIFDSFLDYEPGLGGAHEGGELAKDNPFIFNPRAQQDGFASPRTLQFASDVIKAKDRVSPRMFAQGLAGAVGTATARAIDAVLRCGQNIPPFERVVADPERTPLAKDTTAQMIQVYNFNTRVRDRVQASAVTKYVLRMDDAMGCLFCNSVAAGTKKALFVTAEGFPEMLRKFSIFWA